MHECWYCRSGKYFVPLTCGQPNLLIFQSIQVVLIGFFLAPISARANELGHDRSEEECCSEWLSVDLIEAQACRTLFGDRSALKENHARREQKLESIWDGDYCVDITHDSDWVDPTPLQFKDLTLVDTLIEHGCPRLAMVDLHPLVEEFECEPGLYVLEVDDSLGDDTRVLAIIDGLVLLEHEGDLRYLKTNDSDDPECWRMIWHPPWKLKRPVRSQSNRRRTPKRPRRLHRRKQ